MYIYNYQSTYSVPGLLELPVECHSMDMLQYVYQALPVVLYPVPQPVW